MNLELWQKAAEIKVREYKELLDAGHITQGEYEELVEDIVDLARIQDQLETEDLKNKAVKAIDAIKVVAGLL
jgi:uncharacterized protein YgfB (UPF0149 family)